MDRKKGGRSPDISLYPDSLPRNMASTTFRLIKRTIDLTGSLFAMTLLTPLLSSLPLR